MYKEDHADVEEVYVVGFGPNNSVPNDVLERFDPFLEPLMNIPTIITMVTIVSIAATYGKAGMLNLNKRISMSLTMKHARL